MSVLNGKRLVSLAAMALLVLGGATGAAKQANAAFIITIDQVGSDVVVNLLEIGTAPVTEPASAALLALPMAALGLLPRGRRRDRSAAAATGS